MLLYHIEENKVTSERLEQEDEMEENLLGKIQFSPLNYHQFSGWHPKLPKL
jgi:hypothetical protein